MQAKIWCVGVATLLGLGCSETTAPTPKVAAVSVVPDTASIEVRDTLQLTAVLSDSSGRGISGVEAQWSSSDTSLARVSVSGLVVGTGPGLAWIRATAGGRTDSARVSVLVPVAALTVVPAAVTFVKGSSVLLSPFPRDSAGNYLIGRVTWASSDTSKATIVGGASCDLGPGTCGLATARAPGVVTVTAAAGHQRATVQLTLAVVSFTSLTSAEDHTCGLTPTGSAWCWGLNTIGQLGVPNVRFPRTTPGLVRGGVTFAQLSAGGTAYGGFTCGVATTGAGYCWGQNRSSGALGTLVPGADTMPAPVAGGLPFAVVAGGSEHTCGLTVGDVPYCWGANGAGQLGSDTVAGSAAFAPVPVSGQFRFVALTAGRAHTCGLTSGGAAYCWGANDRGQLGNDSLPSNSNYGPRLVQGGLTFSSIAAGASHTCALTFAGVAYCWGSNAFGELGTGDTVDSHVPVPVGGGLSFGAIAAGDYNTCGVSTSGKAYCWGWDFYGQLGIGEATGTYDPHPTPTAVAGGLQFATIETGMNETCGLTTGGLAYCWGDNNSGQIGDGTYNWATTPALVVGQK